MPRKRLGPTCPVTDYGCATAYKNKGCRCDDCRAWNRARKNKWAAEKGNATARYKYHNDPEWRAARKKDAKKFYASPKGKIAMSKAFYARYRKTSLWQEFWTEENHAAWEVLVAERERLTAETGVPHDIDHIVPLCVGGPHHPANCRVITAKENRSRPKDGSDLA